MFIGTPNLIKKYNSDTIHRMIIEHGPITKPDIARRTELSLPTVNKLVDELEEIGLIRKEGLHTKTTTVGRRAKVYVSNDNAGYIIALFYADGSWIGGVCNLAGKFGNIGRFTINTDNLEQSCKDLQNICEHLMKDHAELLMGVGIGIPGVVNKDTVTSIPQIPCWEGVNIRKELEQRIEIPVFVENDVKLMTVGYYTLECDKDCDHLLFLYVGEGLGSGIIINKRLYKGANCFAGEYSYMILDSDAEPVSLASLESRIQALVHRMEKDDNSAYCEYFRIIGQIAVNFITVIDPERIAIKGIEIDQNSVRKIENEVNRYLPDVIPDIAVVNDDSIGLFGAYQLCLSNTMTHMRIIVQQGI